MLSRRLDFINNMIPKFIYFAVNTNHINLITLGPHKTKKETSHDLYVYRVQLSASGSGTMDVNHFAAGPVGVGARAVPARAIIKKLSRLFSLPISAFRVLSALLVSIFVHVRFYLKLGHLRE